MKTGKKASALLLALCLALSPVMAEETGPYAGGKPWPNTDLKVNLPETADDLSPKDDFHLYVNYDWLKAAEIKTGEKNISRFSSAEDEVKERILALLGSDEPAGHEGDLVRQFYRAYLDHNTRNALGVEPLRPYIDRIASVSCLADLTAVFTDPEMLSLIGAPFDMGNTADFADSSRYVFAVAEPSFLLQSAEEYTSRTDLGDRIYRALKAYMETLLPRFGYTREEADTILDKAIAYETILAEHAYTREDTQGADYFRRIYNITSYDDLVAGTKAFPLDAMLEAAGYHDIRRVMVVNPSCYAATDATYTEENAEAIRDWLIVKMLVSYAYLLDRDAETASLDYKNAVNGSAGYPSDEQRAYEIVTVQLASPLSRAYVEFYDFSATRDRVIALCEDVRAEYREMLAQEDWLTEETRRKAIEKLDAIRINVVRPEVWPDFDTLDFSGKSLFDMKLAISRHTMDRDISRVNGTVDKGIWTKSTTEANAFYSLTTNSINILAGVLCGEFYREDMSDEALYGRVGMFIAHEITHAFDRKGSQFDKDGNTVSWWTEEDMAAFSLRADKLIAFYDAIEPWPGIRCSGVSVQGEAIADMGAVKCMLGIIAKKGLDPKVFFESYAGVWANIRTPEDAEERTRSNPHPLGYLRTNGVVQQFAEFHDTFGIREGDGMYLAPENRVSVW